MNYFYLQHSTSKIFYGEQRADLVLNPDFRFLGAVDSPRIKLVVVQMLKNHGLPLFGYALRPMSELILGDQPND